MLIWNSYFWTICRISDSGKPETMWPLSQSLKVRGCGLRSINDPTWHCCQQEKHNLSASWVTRHLRRSRDWPGGLRPARYHPGNKLELGGRARWDFPQPPGLCLPSFCRILQFGEFPSVITNSACLTPLLVLSWEEGGGEFLCCEFRILAYNQPLLRKIKCYFYIHILLFYNYGL